MAEELHEQSEQVYTLHKCHLATGAIGLIECNDFRDQAGGGPLEMSKAAIRSNPFAVQKSLSFVNYNRSSIESKS